MSVIIEESEVENYLKPVKFDLDNVFIWSNTYKALVDLAGNKIANSMKNKAKRYIKNNLLDYDKETKTFIVNLLPGQTKRPNRIKLVNGEFVCECQGYNTKLNEGEIPFCSHILALKIAFKIGYFRKLDKLITTSFPVENQE